MYGLYSITILNWFGDYRSLRFCATASVVALFVFRGIVMADNSNLHMSRAGKTDEFYTQLSTIEEELRHYRKYFKDKVVLCNCDDPYESNFFKYFALNFNALGLKKLITTCYATSPIVNTQLNIFGEETVFSTICEGRRAYKIEITEVKDADGNETVDLTDVKYLLKSKNNALSLLKGDGDFRSEECLELLRECDIVVTNPPFSLMKEYLPLLINQEKSFVILGNVNHITFSEVKPFVLENKMWLGYNSGHFWFRVPEYYESKGTDYKEDANGQKWRRMGNSCWFTNLDIPKRHIPLDLYAKYSDIKYPKYDDYDAIECCTTKDIPENYFDILGVPITYLPYHCPEQFEILQIVTPKINGKSKYKRLLIRRVKNEN